MTTQPPARIPIPASMGQAASWARSLAGPGAPRNTPLVAFRNMNTVTMLPIQGTRASSGWPASRAAL